MIFAAMRIVPLKKKGSPAYAGLPENAAEEAYCCSYGFGVPTMSLMMICWVLSGAITKFVPVLNVTSPFVPKV